MTNLTGQKKRTLIYFPIVHTPDDLGRLKETVRKAALKKGGLQSLKRKTAFVDRMWTEIEKAIDALDVDFSKTRVFQDALAICGREEQIVRELAGKGSRNHRLVLKLMEKGAALEGAESPELLLREYEHIKKQMESGGGENGLSAEILELRDRFIAARIDEKLRPGETGVIFLGILHNLEKYLPGDVELAYPLYRPFRSDAGSGMAKTSGGG